MTKLEELMLAERKAWELYNEATEAGQKAEEMEEAWHRHLAGFFCGIQKGAT
jgi:hypothetical protein